MKTEFELWKGISASQVNSTVSSGFYYLFTNSPYDRNVSCEAGSIDVHYPCFGEHKLEATVTFDQKILCEYGLTLPPHDILVERLLKGSEFLEKEPYIVKFYNVTGFDIYDSIVISDNESDF